ncbi:sugar transferase [Halomonas sp. BC04]|uniref:sugar transferase n=1 Tax=Halomonas sp. BC04 TaxID=1403540 RepID=UPI0003ED6A70|nr:sugar transferase [Halomonas sp. BC04]EWG98229.1 sugar transferase [Halomonas sp. BC04]
MLKRLFDIIAALCSLVILAPVILVVTLLIRWRLGAPVLFRQARPGLHGKPFEIVKFRTMLDPHDKDGNTLPDEQRMTRLGTLLRSTSLDELPELWNVLKGEMSLVGPRPLLMEYLPLYSKEQYRRHEVRPGVTGWAQVKGRNTLTWDEKFKFDVWYVDNRTFWLDIRILLLTIRKVLQREGISGHGHVTMAPFTGNRPPSDRF